MTLLKLMLARHLSLKTWFNVSYICTIIFRRFGCCSSASCLIISTLSSMCGVLCRVALEWWRVPSSKLPSTFHLPLIRLRSPLVRLLLLVVRPLHPNSIRTFSPPFPSFSNKMQNIFGGLKTFLYLCHRIPRWREMSLIFRVDSDILIAFIDALCLTHEN